MSRLQRKVAAMSTLELAEFRRHNAHMAKVMGRVSLGTGVVAVGAWCVVAVQALDLKWRWPTLAEWGVIVLLFIIFMVIGMVISVEVLARKDARKARRDRSR